jgi:hypothetical protein
MYQLLVETKRRREAWIDGHSSGSNTEREHAAWKCLWSIQVPSKLWVFLWRLAQQSLPTADIRCRRKMAETSMCTIFGDVDSWRHSVIDCSVARCVWALADEEVTENLCMNEDPSAKRWIFSMMESMSRDGFARVAVTLWAIRYTRQNIIHEEVYQSPYQLTSSSTTTYVIFVLSPPKRDQKVIRRIPHTRGGPRLNLDALSSTWIQLWRSPR